MVQSARLLTFSESYCRNLGADCNIVSAQQVVRLLHLLARRNESVNLAQKGEKRLLAQESQSMSLKRFEDIILRQRSFHVRERCRRIL